MNKINLFKFESMLETVSKLSFKFVSKFNKNLFLIQFNLYLKKNSVDHDEYKSPPIQKNYTIFPTTS